MDKNNLKVMLVVPDFFLAIGILAQYIAKACPDIDFYFFYEGGIHRQKDEFLQFLQHIDVLHFLSNMSSIDIPADIDISALPCAVVTTIHHLEPGEEEKKILNAELGDLIHVTAREWEILVHEKSRKPVSLAHQPIDLEQFRQNCNAIRPRVPFRIGWFGISGGLDNRKRLDILQTALSRLNSQKIPFELVVRGSIWNDLSGFFREKGIPVRNLGYVASDRVADGYREVDLYVCTSDIEGGPLTLLEALASGVPVISTPVGQTPEVLKLGGGILVEKNDPTAVAEAIQKIILDRDLYDRLRSETQKVAEEFFGVNITREYISLYQKAIKEHELNSHKPWVSPQPLPVEPKLQREKELVFSLFREARHQKRKGYIAQGFMTAMKAIRNHNIPFNVKMQELRYLLR